MLMPEPFDDPEVPAETLIFYSPKVMSLYVLLAIAMMGYGVYSMLGPKAYIIGAVLIVIPLIIVIIGIKNIDLKKPQIILSSKGIQTGDAPFVPWSQIIGEEVKWIDKGKITGWHLLYTHPSGEVDIHLGDMAIKHQDVAHMLQVYRRRSDRFYGKKPQSVK
jgi:hypothetical protein